MALRNQPYFPLYVQDYLTDEKLNMCSLATQGVFIKILCVLHKQEMYGAILFHQNNKQKLNKFDFFVDYLSKQLPIQKKEMAEFLQELIDEKVLCMDETKLYQRRMLNDGQISIVRSESAKNGGGSNLNKQYGKKGILYFLSDKYDHHKIGVTSNLKQRVYQIRSKNKLSKLFDVVDFINVSDMGKTEDEIKKHFGEFMQEEWIKLTFNEALDKFNLFHQNYKQNTEYEYVNEYVNDNDTASDNLSSNKKSKSKKIEYPTIEQVKEYFQQNGYDPAKGEKAYRYYAESDWKDSKGNAVKNWKQKMQGVWFKDENKIQVSNRSKMVY